MLNRTIKQIFFLFAACSIYAAPDSGGWKLVTSPNLETSTGMVVIQIVGQATLGKKSGNAILYLAGIPKSGNISMGVFLGDLDRDWVGIPWNDFRGPDLNRLARTSTPLEIVLNLPDRRISSSYSALVSGVLLPEQDVGELAEGIIVGPGKKRGNEVSLYKLCKIMADGHDGLEIHFRYSKAKHELRIVIPGEVKNPVLSKFLSSLILPQ